MTNTEFLEELKKLIIAQRNHTEKLKSSSAYSSGMLEDKVKRAEAMLDKLEQDYFHLPTDMSFENITKEFVFNADLINKSEISITEQVKEGLLKVFNDLLKAFDKYVEIRENNELKDYEFDYANFNISLCQIADRLLQIESIEKFRC